MKTSWNKTQGRRTYYIYVNYKEVVVGSDYGTGMSDIAGAVSHSEFLNGTYHDLILERFDQRTLDEVIYAVKNSDKNPDFQDARREVLERKYFIDSIPLDETLKDLNDSNKHPETISGFHAYGNAGGYKTIVKSDSLTLVVDSQEGYLEDEEKKRISFKLFGHCSGVVELHDYFYVVHSNNFAVISPLGYILFDTWNLKFDSQSYLFGYQVRINDVFRNKETIFFKYRFFGDDFPPGLIKFDLKNGFTGRWEIKD